MPTVLLAVTWPFAGKFTGKLCDVTISSCQGHPTKASS